MTQILIAVLAFGCATLSAGVAGLLRRVTDVKLTLSGHGGEHRQFMIETGRVLPDEVLQELPDTRRPALLVLGSDSCETCHEVFRQLDSLPGQIMAGVIHESEEAWEPTVVAGCAKTLSQRAMSALVRELDITRVPLAIAQRDGYIVGAAYGTEIAEAHRLREFWSIASDTQVAEVGT